MDESHLREFLQKIKNGKISLEKGIDYLKNLPYQNIEYAQIDHHRSLRKDFPEVIYCEGKEDDHIVGIITHLLERNSNILATRIRESSARLLLEIDNRFQYNKIARVCFLNQSIKNNNIGKILILSAGTSDLPVVEEAFITAEIMGNNVEKIMDVGVAGIHRILDKKERLEDANVVIVIAGMEGALASVVAGLVEKPIIAVPTSIGYGANFGGLSALLGMLNSCSPSVLTVNIDNGFGAGYAASIINKGMSQTH